MSESRMSARRPTTAELVASVVERVGRLTRDEFDRLALAEPAPIAFLATLRQVVRPDLEQQLDEAESAAISAAASCARFMKLIGHPSRPRPLDDRAGAGPAG